MSYQFPPGFTPISIAASAIKYQTLSSAYAGSLVIPLLLLLLSCPPGVRSTPVFPILVVCLLLGITWGFLSFAENISTVQHPTSVPLRSLFLGSSSLNFLLPILTDSVLIFKLLWLYVGESTLSRAVVAAPPALLFAPRLTVISIFLFRAGQAFDSTGGIQASIAYLFTSKLPLTEFCLQLTSNLYCCSILLYKASTIASGDDTAYRSAALQRRFGRMLKVLASSFVVPVCIQIALITATTTASDSFTRSVLQFSNTNLSLHAAVLATVWSSIGPQSDPSLLSNRSVHPQAHSHGTGSGFSSQGFKSTVASSYGLSSLRSKSTKRGRSDTLDGDLEAGALGAGAGAGAGAFVSRTTLPELVVISPVTFPKPLSPRARAVPSYPCFPSDSSLAATTATTTTTTVATAAAADESDGETMRPAAAARDDGRPSFAPSFATTELTLYSPPDDDADDERHFMVR